jgi:hypothetical protein
MSDIQRELTSEERKAIKKLVASECANYCREHGCLQLNDACYMHGKIWTGAYCTYFRTAVLPLDPKLEVTLTGGGLHTLPCAVCGTHFIMRTNKLYCCAACSRKAHRKQKRDYIRKKRGAV